MRKLGILFLTCLVLVGCGSKEPPVTINRGEVLVDNSDVDIPDYESESSNEISSSEQTQDTEYIEPAPPVEPNTEYSTEIEQGTETQVEEPTTEDAIVSEVNLTLVRDIINNLFSATSQDSVNSYLETISTTDNFTFSSVVNKETKVSIESIGVNYENSNEYLAIVTLRQDGGISKFSIVVTFDDSKLSKVEYFRF